MVNALANPVVLRCAVVLFFAGGLFLLAIWTIRAVKKSIAEEANLNADVAPSLENLPLHLYNTVIQQLKQQKHELQVQNQAEQRRLRTTENFSQAVLSNLSSGVLVFGANGLVKQANPAAKKILGFNSPFGMNPADIFRGAQVCQDQRAGDVQVTEEVEAVLRGGSKNRQIEADYKTPEGKRMRLSMTISQVPSVEGDMLGVACLMADRTEFEQIQNQQRLQGEISAEMALELRTSLATITGYAQQLGRGHNGEQVSRLAADIASEAERLERRIGGFLASKPAAAGARS